MFWKKKSDKKKKTLINAAPEIRGAFRVEPLPHEPIEFTFSGKKVRVTDISAGGLSFKNDHFQEGNREEISFKLPNDPREIRCILEVVRIIEAKDLCCTQFVDLTNEQDDMVGRYVLERQKFDLQRKKGLL